MRAITDAQRPLTERGEVETSHVAQAGIKAGMQPTKVYVSPYLRAQQSWQQVKQWLPEKTPIETLDLITPDNNPAEVLDYLIAHSSDEKEVLLVCHQPLVGRLITLLSEANSHGMGLNTSTLVAIECEVPAADCGELLWLKDPSNC